ncbi:MAG TPA: NAD(P)-dependent oxidoreductase [Cyclobacteriaceae bacterium]|jgi:saccharopine dehydrogenase (NAD+, L-lysine-forming)|nr:alanine dehydrogenase [Cytophagales bacterium]HRE67988.1 NAD(P)-dependent oxidoreductase [Cyclobacteriaceae bacterium]HRF33590.1 NAD(P)-dependent oxidoreductase [Cyclobacteriaceae bacterium]
MSLIKIGLIREGKNPPDKRVPFTPAQAEEIEQRFPHAKVICQQSEVRCFNDSEYETHHITTQPGVDDCDILMGIKEVPVEMLVPNKTYLFFSHTIKKQPYNRKLLQAILQKNIRLIDYEALKDTQGNRLVAFGRFAGIVGAYNGLWAYGKRFKQYELRRAYDCFDINDLKLELRKVKLPPIKIILTGAGRVGKGAMETLDTAGIRKVSPTDFLTKTYSEPVYSQLSSAEYHERKEGGHFNRDEFHRNPEYYQSTFDKFLPVTDILMAGAFWNPKAPVLFTRENMLAPNFKIKIIADITCDINGSVPSTIKASSIPNPLYDYNAKTNSDFPAFSDEKFVTVMAVDNLPCELPRSASDEFGRDLIDRILKPLLFDDPEGIIKRGTITDNGKLTEEFSYLQDYVNQPT